MEADLKNLQIDRAKKRSGEPSRWATRWIVTGILVLLVAGGARFAYTRMNAPTEVSVVRVQASAPGAAVPQGVILNATGYIIAHHKIEVAAKVIGRVEWIGVDQGDLVQEGQVIVRLEDDEYRAQVQQAKGNLDALQAKLNQAINGSRPEEIAVAESNMVNARADQEDARLTLERTKKLAEAKVVSRQILDDAQAKYDGAVARVNSLKKTLDLANLGPRKEEIDALRGQVVQAKGALDYAETQLANTVIKAPVAGTILERAVEKGEFVTTSFVGDKGAKGYVVSLADLKDLQVELDIAQNDFAKLHAKQKGEIRVDAFPDRKYAGYIYEVAPEANRQKATVQVKVKVVDPDNYLRPEMNASVAFLSDDQPKHAAGASAESVIIVPASAIKEGAVFVVLNGKAIRRAVTVGMTNSSGVRVKQGLIGGEDVIVNPPAGLADGANVKLKG
ncbi:MAG TPA: efflux RND transporter periplasmic adaptor subunit [Bryobacteraceae bacterium]|jgi:HlyD family secretion protein